MAKVHMLIYKLVLQKKHPRMRGKGGVNNGENL
jgi:hypothetical protein